MDLISYSLRFVSVYGVKAYFFMPDLWIG